MLVQARINGPSWPICRSSTTTVKETQGKVSDVGGTFCDSQEGVQHPAEFACLCSSAGPLARGGGSRAAWGYLHSGWKGACQILTKHQTVQAVKTAHETVRNSQPNRGDENETCLCRALHERFSFSSSLLDLLET
jgi:hypothetical protein